jgi:uncharacterized membrane protein YuzA (DUF378 family)
MKSVHMAAFILLVIGGLNWGLEAFGYGIGMFVPPMVAKVIYILVGLSAVYEIATHKGRCPTCGGAPVTPAV